MTQCARNHPDHLRAEFSFWVARANFQDLRMPFVAVVWLDVPGTQKPARGSAHTLDPYGPVPVPSDRRESYRRGPPLRPRTVGTTTRWDFARNGTVECQIRDDIVTPCKRTSGLAFAPSTSRTNGPLLSVTQNIKIPYKYGLHGELDGPDVCTGLPLKACSEQ